MGWDRSVSKSKRDGERTLMVRKDDRPHVATHQSLTTTSVGKMEGGILVVCEVDLSKDIITFLIDGKLDLTPHATGSFVFLSLNVEWHLKRSSTGPVDISCFTELLNEFDNVQAFDVDSLGPTAPGHTTQLSLLLIERRNFLFFQLGRSKRCKDRTESEKEELHDGFSGQR